VPVTRSCGRSTPEPASTAPPTRRPLIRGRTVADTRPRRRLDQPRSGRRFSVDIDPETFGRFSESLARFMGTGTFLFWQTLLVIMWITLNIVGVGFGWDPYPFILLNLAFSTQAAYAAPLILLAQNRQDDRDRITLEEDRNRSAQTKADTEFLARELAALRVAIGEVATRDYLRGELDRLRVDLEEMTNPDSADKPAKRTTDKRLKGRTKPPAKAQAPAGRPKGGASGTSSPAGGTSKHSSVDTRPVDPALGGDPVHGADDGPSPN